MIGNYFTSSAPVLASLDLDRSVEFYNRVLGTTSVLYDDYAVLDSGIFSIHLWKCDDKYIAENTSCYIFVTNIAELYTELQSHGVIHPNGALEEKSYGMKEFSILDPDGNLIKFGEAL